MATSALSWFSGGQKTRPGVLYPHAQWWFALCLVMTWVGFSRSYFAQINTEPLLHHIHGALMVGWIVTLILQPILYQQNRIRLHLLAPPNSPAGMSPSPYTSIWRWA